MILFTDCAINCIDEGGLMNKRQTKMLMVLVLSCVLLLSSIYKGYSVTYEEVIHSSNETNTNANSNYDGMDLTDIECCGEIDDGIERLVFPFSSDTEIILDFNNDMSRTVIVNPKAKITGVQVTGEYVVGKELTADVEADLIKENYDIEYQWQSSPNGTDWYDINHANEKQYIITNNELLRYIRIVIKSASKYGNVEYPSSATSKSSITKCVVLGDTDLDGYVNIDDATNIQKYLVSLEEFNVEQKVAADVNENGSIAIDDVTAIQKILVQEI